LHIDWHLEAMALWRQGAKWMDIAEAVKESFTPDKNIYKIKEIVRKSITKTDEYKVKCGTGEADQPIRSCGNIMQTAIEKLKVGTTLDALAQSIGLSAGITTSLIGELRGQGYNIQEAGSEIKISTVVVPGLNIINSSWDGNKIIRFGLMGDTQINSKYTQITHLHRLYDVYAQEGIGDVYHVGDIDEGEEMRQGHKYECYSQGADDHIAEIVKVYPKRDGITTHFITGNHDHSIIKRAGFDIGNAIAAQRTDMVYLGQSSAIICLTDNCTMELRHPIDGTAYALSYKLQKMIEAMSGGEKPNILAVGHYHKADYMFYRNVHSFQTGCFQAQTPWMRGKGIAAMLGGWIVEVIVNDSGTIERLKQEFIPFYRGIKDDYKSWQ